MLAILEPLLAIKSFREAREARALERQRRVLSAADRHLVQCQQVLQDFEAHAQDRERALLQELYGQVVRLPQIEAAHAQIDELRHQARIHAKQVEQARAERHRQDQELQLRRQAHGYALQAKERFVEVVRVATEDARLAAEHAEGLELEEVAESRGRLGADSAKARPGLDREVEAL